MESAETLELLVRLIPDLIFSAVLLYLYLKKIKSSEVREKVLSTAFSDNAKAQLENAKAQVLTANAIDNNTKAVEQLILKVEQIDVTTKVLMSTTEKINEVWRNTAGSAKG